MNEIQINEIQINEMAINVKQLWDLLEQIPEEIVARLGLDEMLLDGRAAEAGETIRKIIAYREGHQVSELCYHTTDRRYESGDQIFPSDSTGKYQGKVFVSRSLRTAFTDDRPRFCYRVQAQGLRPDLDDLTGKDWAYTLTPALVLEEIPMEDVLRAKRLGKQDSL